jgi:hypothetical protein
MNQLRCPVRGSSAVATGFLSPHGSGRESRVFVPHVCRLAWFRWKQGVQVSTNSNACVACGLVWTRLEVGELRAFIERYGDIHARVTLAS